MKKDLLLLSAVLLCMSCQKTNINSTDTQRTSTATANGTYHSSTARKDWGKYFQYVDEYTITDDAPYNCYAKVKADTPTIRQISTPDGPRYAGKVADYFNGSDWKDVFPGLLNEENAGDLGKLQSGDYYFEVHTNGNFTFLVTKKVTDTTTIDFVLVMQADI